MVTVWCSVQLVLVWTLVAAVQSWYCKTFRSQSQSLPDQRHAEKSTNTYALLPASATHYLFSSSFGISDKHAQSPRLRMHGAYIVHKVQWAESSCWGQQ